MCPQHTPAAQFLTQLPPIKGLIPFLVWFFEGSLCESYADLTQKKRQCEKAPQIYKSPNSQMAGQQREDPSIEWAKIRLLFFVVQINQGSKSCQRRACRKKLNLFHPSAVMLELLS